MFLIKSLKLPTANFNISQYILFISSNTRSGDHQKLVHPRTTLFCTIIFTLTVLPEIWNYFTSDKPNTASPHYQAENKIISLGTFH